MADFFIDIAPTANYGVTSSVVDDAIIYTSTSNQKILLGCSNQAPYMSLTKSNVCIMSPAVASNLTSSNLITYAIASSNSSALSGFAIDFSACNLSACNVNFKNLTVNNVPITGMAYGWSNNTSNIYSLSNIGIGTSSPQYNLDVVSTARTCNMFITNTATICNLVVTGTATGATLGFLESGVSSGIYTNCNVAFGVSGVNIPGYKIDCYGDINVTGSYRRLGTQLNMIPTSGGAFTGAISMGGLSTDMGSNFKLQLRNDKSGLPVNTGTIQTNGVFRVRGGQTTCLDFGVMSNNDGCWLQTADTSALSTTSTPILLNPLGGGPVGIGVSNIQGDIQFNTMIRKTYLKNLTGLSNYQSICVVNSLSNVFGYDIDLQWTNATTNIVKRYSGIINGNSANAGRYLAPNFSTASAEDCEIGISTTTSSTTFEITKTKGTTAINNVDITITLYEYVQDRLRVSSVSNTGTKDLTAMTYHTLTALTIKDSNVGIQTPNPLYPLHVTGTISTNNVIVTNTETVNTLNSSNITVSNLLVTGGASISNLTAPGGNLSITGSLLPVADANPAYNIGSSSFKWSTIYAQNGTIQTSDNRLKTNIETSPLGLEFIESLKPVKYNWTDAGSRDHYGFVAQDVKEAYTKLGIKDFGGWSIADEKDPNSMQGLNYSELICPLVKAVQELKAIVDLLRK